MGSAVGEEFGGSVCPAKSAGMMTDAPAAAGLSGVASATPVGSGSSVFHTASAGMMAGGRAAEEPGGLAPVLSLVMVISSLRQQEL